MDQKSRLNPLESSSLEMRDRAKTFYWAARFLPADIRKDLSQIYKFCRYVDDTVDQASDRTAARIGIDRIIADLESKTSLIKEVADFLTLARARDIPLTFAIDLASGVKSDMAPVHMLNDGELVRYCYRVAATVGMMICYLLDVTAPDAVAFGIDLGIAMQLTNIVRDVYEDYAADRIYLPASLISAETIAKAAGGQEAAQRKLFEVAKELISLAEQYYLSSENGICYLPQSSKLAIMSASRAYRMIGELVVRQPSQYAKSRISTNLVQKQKCLFSAAISLATERKYHKATFSQGHRTDLHHALQGLPSFDVVFS